MSTSIRSMSDLLLELQAAFTEENITLSDLIDHFHERGFGFLLFIFAFPMALPLPVPPGLNIMMATPLIVLTAQQALGRHTIWIPKRLRYKSVSRGKLGSLINKAMPWIQRLEIFIKPRLGTMTQRPFSHLIGFFGLIMALTICVPLPMTNTVPSLGIALMAIGVVMRDGLAVLAGAIIGMIWVIALSYALLFLGEQGLGFIKDVMMP